MVQPQAYKPNYDIVARPFDDPANFSRVVQAVGEIPPGDFILSVPNDDYTGHVDRKFTRPEALRHRLNVAAQVYGPDLWDTRRPTPKQICEWLERTRKSIKRTIDNLRSEADPEASCEPARLIPLLDIEMQMNAGARIVPVQRTIVEMMAMRSLRELQNLHDWLGHAIAYVDEQAKGSEQRPAYEGDRAMDGLIESLMEIWRDVLDRKITTTTATDASATPGEVRGPLIQFLQVVVPIVNHGNETPTSKAFRSRINRIRAKWKEQRQSV